MPTRHLDDGRPLLDEASRALQSKKIKRIKHFIWDLLWSQYAPGWVLWLLISYLIKVRGDTLIFAAATVNLFDACTSFLSVFPTILINTWPGLYYTTLLSTLTYAAGLSILWRIALTGSTDNKLFYIALSLCALGKSGTEVTFMPFFHNQKELYKHAPEDEHSSLTFEIIVMNVIGALLLFTGLVVVPFLTSWKVLFGVASLTMVFISYKLLRGYSVLNNLPLEPKQIGHEQSMSMSITIWGIVRIVPIWTTFLVPAMVASIGSTYFVEEADTMSTKVFGWKYLILPLPTLFANSTSAMNKARELYTGLRKSHDSREAVPTMFITLGAVMSILCCVTAALVELRRIAVIEEHGEEEPIRMSLLWLVVQFWFLGAAYGFGQSGVKGFLEDQLPRRVHRYSGLVTEMTFGSGTVLSVLAVYLAERVSSDGGTKTGWFGDTINSSRMDYFYWMLALFSFVNLVIFLVLNSCYGHGEVVSSDEEEEVEDNNPVVPGIGNHSFEEVVDLFD